MKRWFALAFALLASGALAQDWPQRPVKIIAPFAAASTPDTFARVLADYLRKRVGQPVVVENRPGAVGMIGTDEVAKAAHNGYTLVVCIRGPFVHTQLTLTNTPIAPIHDH